MTTTVVHVNSDEWKNTPEDQRVYIGRANKPRKFAESQWANPHKIGLYDMRYIVIHKHERDLRQSCLESPALFPHIQTELRGKVLGCWCHPKACHGDLLMWLADATDEEYEEWLNAR